MTILRAITMIATLLVASSSLTPAEASAQSWTSATASALSRSGSLNLGGAALVLGMIPYGLATTATIVLSVADIVSYATNSPFSDGLAVLDFIGAGLNFIGSAIFFGVAAANDSPLAGLGAGHAVLGTHLLLHGIWSLANNDPLPISVSASPDGAAIGYSGSF